MKYDTIKAIHKAFELQFDLALIRIEFANHNDTNDVMIRLEEIINKMDNLINYIKDRYV